LATQFLYFYNPNQEQSMKRSVKAGLLTAMTLGILSACGGGGTGVAPSLVAGTAATGAAIAAGAVTLKCVSGTTTAVTTGTDGSFTIDVSNVTLPCVGRVDYKDASGAAQRLHTFISAKGTANITPITELLVANLTGGTALDAFDKFDATKTKAFTAAQVTAAAAAVKTYLKNTLGVDTTNLPDDPVGAKFVPQNGTTAGDAFDKVLDAIQAKLKAGGQKLSDISAALASPVASGSTNILIVSGVTPLTGNGNFSLPNALENAAGGVSTAKRVTFTDGTPATRTLTLYYQPATGALENISYESPQKNFSCFVGEPIVPCPTAQITFSASGKSILFGSAVFKAGSTVNGVLDGLLKW
jgi:hypothetical protein